MYILNIYVHPCSYVAIAIENVPINYYIALVAILGITVLLLLLLPMLWLV